jgi:hypothetical protein
MTVTTSQSPALRRRSSRPSGEVRPELGRDAEAGQDVTGIVDTSARSLYLVPRIESSRAAFSWCIEERIAESTRMSFIRNSGDLDFSQLWAESWAGRCSNPHHGIKRLI